MRMQTHLHDGPQNTRHNSPLHCRFLCDGQDCQAERDSRFKLIPSVIHSSWIIKQAVGTTPVLLGNKLATRYFRRAAFVIVSTWKVWLCSSVRFAAIL